MFKTTFRTNLHRLTVLLVLTITATARGQTIDWGSVPLIQHSTYQSVTDTGASSYSSGFPIRLQGVVLNDSEDWLDPTANFSSTLGEIGGEAEIFVQAVNAGDFGGTAAWMGQCYGNATFIDDPSRRYSDDAWYSELRRLGYYYQGTSQPGSQLVRAGDLIEIRALGGLSYAGKMNVNEKHQIDAFNFEIVVLERGYGLPTPTSLQLDDLKTPLNEYIFDATRQKGGERYQSTLVTLENVSFVNSAAWGKDEDLMLTDASGLTFPVHLGLDDSFLTAEAPSDHFNVTGILNQVATGGGTNGYCLIATSADAFVAVPEPGTLALLLTGIVAMILQFVRRRS